MARWSRSVGGWGYRVRVFERSPGRLYLEWRDPETGEKVRQALKHDNREAALEAAKAKVAGRYAGRTGGTALTVGALLQRYAEEVSRHKKGAQPAEDRRRRAIWEAFLGTQRQVVTLDFPTIDRFVRLRRRGELVVPERKLAPQPSDGTIGGDIVYLQTALHWAQTVTDGTGDRLLAVDPLAGYRRPRHTVKRRPVATDERFRQVRQHAYQLTAEPRFGPFFDLVEALGWRVSALCQVRVADVDLTRRDDAPYGRVLRRRETDKEGHEQWVPLDRRARHALRQLLRIQPQVGDVPLFPRPRPGKGKPPKPWTRWYARDLLQRAEQAAGLEPLEGGDFHPYRRKWATERKHLPTPDVMLAGGWTDRRSLETAYQQPDEATILRVMLEPRKLCKDGLWPTEPEEGEDE